MYEMTSLEFHKVISDDTALVNFVNKEAELRHWRLGCKDVETFAEFSHPGIYVAKLDGVSIGCICFTQYSDDYYNFALYIIKEEYRGKGYGMQMFEAIKKKVDWSKNVVAFAEPEMVEKYKRVGFHPRFLCTVYLLQLSSTLKKLQTLPINQDLIAKDPRDVNQVDLLTYDSNVYGYQRHALMLMWIYSEYHHSKVVVNNSGDIVGYATARVVYNKDDGYDIAPLFADSIEAAYVLLKALFEKLQNDGGSSSETISVICPVGVNSKSKDFIDVLQGTRCADGIFITTKDLQNGCMDKWFGIYPGN